MVLETRGLKSRCQQGHEYPFFSLQAYLPPHYVLVYTEILMFFPTAYAGMLLILLSFIIRTLFCLNYKVKHLPKSTETLQMKTLTSRFGNKLQLIPNSNNLVPFQTENELQGIKLVPRILIRMGECYKQSHSKLNKTTWAAKGVGLLMETGKQSKHSYEKTCMFIMS